MRLLVTGSEGFVGKNLCLHLRENGFNDIATLTRRSTEAERTSSVAAADFIFHLAGTNRSSDVSDFAVGNLELTATLCRILTAAGRATPIVYASSTQAASDNPYGRSKAGAEAVIERYAATVGTRVHILRLNNIFGKWSRPDYNSVVSTFCYNIARGLPIYVHDPSSPLSLIYIDEVVKAMAAFLSSGTAGEQALRDMPVYGTTVGALADQLRAFDNSRQNLVTEPVGTGLVHALYATYVSYLPTDRFGYTVLRYTDPRGTFIEMLKTRDSGQFSCFTAHPGVTRGGHYHHSKTEKFLVIRGRALFKFRHIITGERLELHTTGDSPQIVETVPGWSHDITNVGDVEMIVMLWANEVFDRLRPDTHKHGV
jgi:UDP-2-acetamido-2,6-beta-L-arabino-hexul-4-ose reductase